MKREYDYLFVGAGLFNAVLCHRAMQSGKKCLVIERRDELGGNCHTYRNADGIDVHKYGAHIFHTSNRNVWDFVNRFTTFNRFTNSPIALYRATVNDKYEKYNLPFNMNTFNQLYGAVTPDEARTAIRKECQGVGLVHNLADQAIQMVGPKMFEKLVRHYTEKQWGRKCEDLSPDIIKRLPLRFTYDNNYFNDTYQGIPENGYTKMIERMFGNVEIRYNVDFLKHREEYEDIADHIFYSGCIAELMKYAHGYLEYRSLDFNTKTVDTANYQGNAVVNYTGPVEKYTRIIEHKWFTGVNTEHSVITVETPQKWTPGLEPYYPIESDRNRALYNLYRECLPSYITPTGRLGLYRYLDMDKVIADALQMQMPETTSDLPWYKRILK